MNQQSGKQGFPSSLLRQAPRYMRRNPLRHNPPSHLCAQEANGDNSKRLLKVLTRKIRKSLFQRYDRPGQSEWYFVFRSNQQVNEALILPLSRKDANFLIEIIYFLASWRL